jgi:glutamate racemase
MVQPNQTADLLECRPVSQAMTDDRRPIGLFDSGLGGLSVLAAMRAALPAERFLYLADQANAPYGDRSPEEILVRAEKLTAWLLERGAKMVVVACNTASAQALDLLRGRYPEIPFVGMEPAVKPAAAQSRTKVIGVLATTGTLNAHRFASLVVRHAAGVKVVERACPGLADMVERGECDGPEAEKLVRRFVEPVLAAGADTLVLGCTHYTFLATVVRQVAGPGVEVIDPCGAVAAQATRVLQSVGAAPATDIGDAQYFTTTDPQLLSHALARLVGQVSVEHAAC